MCIMIHLTISTYIFIGDQRILSNVCADNSALYKAKLGAGHFLHFEM